MNTARATMSKLEEGEPQRLRGIFTNRNLIYFPWNALEGIAHSSKILFVSSNRTQMPLFLSQDWSFSKHSFFFWPRIPSPLYLGIPATLGRSLVSSHEYLCFYGDTFVTKVTVTMVGSIWASTCDSDVLLSDVQRKMNQTCGGCEIV